MEKIALLLMVLLLVSPVFAQDAIIEEAQNEITQIGDDMHEMQDANFSVVYINDSLIEALEELNKSNYQRVTEIAGMVRGRKAKAYEITDFLRALELTIEEYEGLKVNTTEARGIHELAETSFQEERYEEAEAYLQEAEENLESARAERTALNIIKEVGKGFLEKYWKQLLVAALTLAVSVPIAWKLSEKKRAKNKLETLRIEEKTILNLMKKTQMGRFSTQTIPAKTYEIRMKSYKKKLADIKGKIPVYGAIARGETLQKEKKEE